MACNLTQGSVIACRDSIGGISEVLVTGLDNKQSITASSGIITAFTLNTGKQFWRYSLEKENGSFEEKPTVSQENGTLFYEQTVTFNLKKLGVSYRDELHILAQQRLMIIVKDNNGVYWLIGEANGADMTDGTGTSGKAFGDMSGYTLSFLGKEAARAQSVTASLLTALATPA